MHARLIFCRIGNLNRKSLLKFLNQAAPATIMSQQLVNGKKRQSQSQLTFFFKPPPGGLMRDSLSSFKQPIR
jgi:hypothetical protein